MNGDYMYMMIKCCITFHPLPSVGFCIYL